MGKLLNMDVKQKEAGCRGCHAMGFVEKDHEGDLFDHRDGVSCDACHGPASEWLQKHTEPRTWRATPADKKFALGMNDLRDPVVRTRVCLSCHVGDAAEGKVVTHAMYAAGHPPLPDFEVAVFSANLPQHFRNQRDVPFLIDPTKSKFKFDKDTIWKEYYMATADYQQTQLTAASSLVGLRSAMHLVAARSNLGGADPTRRWPELLMPFDDFKGKEKELPSLWPQLAMAQSDCYACHHELQQPSWRQVRGFPGRPGRPQVRPWPMALARQGLGLEGAAHPSCRKRWPSCTWPAMCGRSATPPRWPSPRRS